MTFEQLAYWLQGFFELNPSIKTLDELQTQVLRDHVQECFTKVTPNRSYKGLQDLLKETSICSSATKDYVATCSSFGQNFVTKEHAKDMEFWQKAIDDTFEKEVDLSTQHKNLCGIGPFTAHQDTEPPLAGKVLDDILVSWATGGSC